MKRSILLSIVIGIFCGMPVRLCAMEQEPEDVEMAARNIPGLKEDAMPLLEAEGNGPAVIEVKIIQDEGSEEKNKSSMEKYREARCFVNPSRKCCRECFYDGCKVAPFFGCMFGGLIYFLVLR